MKKPSITGGGGQLGSRGNISPCNGAGIPQRLRTMRLLSRTGIDVSHARRRGTSGMILELKGRREIMRARGMSGRLR